MCAVPVVAIYMHGPEREGDVIKRNYLNIEFVSPYNRRDVVIPPIRPWRRVVDRLTLELHGAGIALARPVAI